MSNNRTYVGLIGFILLILACAKPKDFDYLGLHNAKVLKWGVKETVLGMDVQFYNPNSRLQLKKADVDVYINNKFLGRTVMDSLINIPKKDTFIRPMIMTVETITALSGVLQSIGDTSVLLKLDGKASVGKSGVFFNYPIKYEGSQKMAKIIGGEDAR